MKWADDVEKNALFARRTKGEAYGLRGMFLYYLLRAHAGFGENGELLGVPILKESQTVESNFNLPRASFQACVEQIYSCLLYTSLLIIRKPRLSSIGGYLLMIIITISPKRI